MSEFTKKDREFIIKIAKMVDDNKKATDLRLDKLEGKDDTVLSPIQPVKAKRNNKRDRFSWDKPFGEMDSGSAIQITFKKGQDDAMKQQVLIESIYMTLKQLCEDNAIEKLLIKIEE